MKNIVVATDFSSRSDRAVQRGAMLARLSGATMHLAHVVDDDWHPQLLEAGLRESEALLKEQAASIHDKHGVTCTYLVKSGDPATGITGAAGEIGADLLIVGPHRREVLRDIFVGTTAERVIRSSRVPVLMTSGAASAAYARIVVATDLSPASAKALQALETLGLRGDAAPWLVYCAEPYRSGGAALALLPESVIAGHVKAEAERAQAELDAFAGPLSIPADRRIARLVQDSVAATVHRVAADLRADLIVVGTHGRTGIERLMLGSVAAAILGLAQIDVLAVPTSTKG